MKGLSAFRIASMYIGIMMGAGFASGRECWQFFGVFGSEGIYGILIYFVLILMMTLMLTYIAGSKQSSELGDLISPFETPFIRRSCGLLMAAVYYTLIIAMTAAGGALLNQMFGISPAIGGGIIAVLVFLTVIGDFERLSSIFSRLIPVIFFFSIFLIAFVISKDYDQSGATTGYEPSSLASTLPAAALVFASYNGTGMISMAGNSALRAENRRAAYIGSILGSIALAGLTFLLFKACGSDMAFTASLDLPMLGFAERISTPLAVAYSAVLFAAMYSTGASTYYAFSTVLPQNKYKKYVIAAGIAIGYLIGLTGFKSIVAYLYPIQGYIGIIFIVFIVINWFKEFTKNRKRVKYRGRN